MKMPNISQKEHERVSLDEELLGNPIIKNVKPLQNNDSSEDCYYLTINKNSFSDKKEDPSLVCARIPIDLSTSIRKNETPKCLVIGRQARVCDIRIDHKSVSRRHAVLYYTKDGKLMIKDVCGKKCMINESEITSKSSKILTEGDVLQFGNSGLNFLLEKQTSSTNSSNEKEAEVVPYDRAAREAEIAAIMSSLDKAPTYKKSDLGIYKKDFNLDIPVSQCVTIEASSPKLVSCMAFDPSGSRFITGSSSDTISLWDFGGMDSSRRPFKLVQVEEGHALVDMAFSPTGNKFIVASSATPKVYDRDGNELKQFAKGDPYVFNMEKTKGHVNSVTSCLFHPFRKDNLLTSSLDGSVRLWDLSYKTAFGKLTSKKVFRIKNEQSKKTSVSVATYHPSGRFFVAGTTCGSIQLFLEKNLGNRPNHVIWKAHKDNDKNLSSVTCLVFNIHGNKLASRGLNDHQLHIWNVSLNGGFKILITIPNVPNRYDYANCYFSPKGDYLILGTSKNQNNSSKAQVHLVKDGSLVWEHSLKQSTKEINICKVYWHAKLNQIFVGLSNGIILVFFSDNLDATKGIHLANARLHKTKDQLDLLLESRASTVVPFATEILTPLVREFIPKRKRLQAEEEEEALKNIPEKPAPKGIKTGGQTSSGYNFTQMVVSSQIHHTKYLSAKRDPREELFKYKEGKNFGTVMAGALANKTVEQEEEDMK